MDQIHANKVYTCFCCTPYLQLRGVRRFGSLRRVARSLTLANTLAVHPFKGIAKALLLHILTTIAHKQKNAVSVDFKYHLMLAGSNFSKSVVDVLASNFPETELATHQPTQAREFR